MSSQQQQLLQLVPNTATLLCQTCEAPPYSLIANTTRGLSSQYALLLLLLCCSCWWRAHKQ